MCCFGKSYEIKSIFYTSCYANIQFYFDEGNTETIATISSQTFSNYSGSINQGFKQGFYWFVVLESSEDQIIQFENSHINHVTAYQNDKQLTPNKNQNSTGTATIVGFNPLFVDEAGGDYRFQSKSPLFDAGNNNCNNTYLDLDENPIYSF